MALSRVKFAGIDSDIFTSGVADSAQVQAQFDSAFPSAFDTRFALQDTHDSAAVQAQLDSAFPSAFDTRLAGDVALGNMTTTGYLRGPATFTIDPSEHDSSTGTLRVRGNLTVDGTTTTINSTTVTTADKNIVIAQGAVDSAAADGAGITVDTVNASLTYSHNDSGWKFNRGLEITSGDLHVSELNSQITQGPALNASVHTGMGIKASTPRFTMEPTGDIQSSRIQFAKTDGTMWGSIFAYNTGEQLQYSAATHKFKTASTERMRIDSAGDIYIGNNGSAATRVVEISGTNTGTNPAANGHIAGDLRLRNVSATDNNHSAISWYNSNNAVDSRITGVHKSHSSRYGELAFLTHNGSALGERMRIDRSGNIGIGAQTPSSMLHLNGTNPIITFTNSAGTSGNQGFRIAFDNDRLTFQRASDGGAFEANYLAINQDTGKIGVMITDPSEYLEFSRTAGKIGWGMNGNWGVRIGYFDDGGGTHGFHVDTKNSGTVTSESRFVVRADTGRVGIGTKNPRYNLEVEGSSSTAVGIAVDNNTGGCNIDLAALGSSYSSHGAAANEAWLYCQNNINLGSASGQSSSVKFLSGGSERARIDSNGTLESKVAQGTAHISNATGTATIANNGTVDFALFSGMIIGNNHNTGDTTIWICGGGGVVRVSSTGSAYGSVSYVSSIGGYRWTNNTGSSRVMSFMTFKTRNYA